MLQPNEDFKHINRNFRIFGEPGQRFVLIVRSMNIAHISNSLEHILDHATSAAEATVLAAEQCSVEDRVSLECLVADGLFDRPEQETLKPPYCDTCFDPSGPTDIAQLGLELTQRCNLRCKYCTYNGCYPNHRVHGASDMAVETIEKAASIFVERCRTDPPPAVSFYGGEAMLCEDRIRDAVTLIRNLRSDILFYIDTNGTRCSEEMLQFVLDNDL